MRSADSQQLSLSLCCWLGCLLKLPLTWVLIFCLKCSQRLKRPPVSLLPPAEPLLEPPELWEQWLDLHSLSLFGWACQVPAIRCSLPETAEAESKSACFHTNCFFSLQKLILKNFINVCRTP